jgi:putative nucleotidyltransferase with HDIG domain
MILIQTTVRKSGRGQAAEMKMVDLVGFEPTTSSMPWKRAPNCATGPREDTAERIFFYDNIDSRMDRNQAWELLCEFTKSDSLRRHALAVETCVAAYARKLGEDQVKWSVTALLHDFDYEMHPDAPDHPMKGEPILAERGVHEEIRRAILSHANYSGVPRVSPLEKTLFACDELAGFLTAVSYVKPTRSINEVDVKSVRKKLRDKGFARSVSREDITNGAAELGIDLDEHIEFCIRAMQARAADLGL